MEVESLDAVSALDAVQVLAEKTRTAPHVRISFAGSFLAAIWHPVAYALLIRASYTT
jgi:hypothetical protein